MEDEYDKVDMFAGAGPKIFGYARILRRNMTVPESLLWDFLKNKPLGFKFRRQHPFYTYVLDFYCHKAKIAIEIDGKSHFEKKQKEYDEERTRMILKFGVTEFRFKNKEVLNAMDNVQNQIIDFLKNWEKENGG